VIGYILLIPSIVGILFCVVGFIRALGLSSTVENSAVGTMVSGIFFVVGIGFLVGGLLGWLLVMKKQILQCNRCGAVVAAS
jgi:hypothetical protein